MKTDFHARSVALIVQIHLCQNRLDLAQQEVRRARSWAQDNLLVNIAESWVGLREVSMTEYGLFVTNVHREARSIKQHSTSSRSLPLLH